MESSEYCSYHIPQVENFEWVCLTIRAGVPQHWTLHTISWTRSSHQPSMSKRSLEFHIEDED